MKSEAKVIVGLGRSALHFFTRKTMELQPRGMSSHTSHSIISSKELFNYVYMETVVICEGKTTKKRQQNRYLKPSMEMAH